MQWGPVLKKNLLKSILADLVNSTRDPPKKYKRQTQHVFNAIQIYT